MQLLLCFLDKAFTATHRGPLLLGCPMFISYPKSAEWILQAGRGPRASLMGSMPWMFAFCWLPQHHGCLATSDTARVPRKLDISRPGPAPAGAGYWAMPFRRTLDCGARAALAQQAFRP